MRERGTQQNGLQRNQVLNRREWKLSSYIYTKKKSKIELIIKLF